MIQYIAKVHKYCGGKLIANSLSQITIHIYSLNSKAHERVALHMSCNSRHAGIREKHQFTNFSNAWWIFSWKKVKIKRGCIWGEMLMALV